MQYELYYWPGRPGRGEFIRLVLEQAGADYTDVCQSQGVDSIMALRKTQAGFAPPYLKDGDLILAQMPAIAMYLGIKHGLVSSDPAQSTRVLQMILTVCDVVNEVHDTHHPINVALAYEEQMPEAKKRADGFVGGRLSGWLEYFDRMLPENNWIVGQSVTVADLFLFQLYEGLSYAFPAAFGKCVSPALSAHRDRVAQLPNIAAYLDSPRRQPFNEQGIFRRYPELDLASVD